MVRNNGRSSRWPMASTRSLVTTYATYGTLSLRIDYQPPGQKPRFARCLQEGDLSKIKHKCKSANLSISLATLYILTDVSWVFQRRRSKRHETYHFPLVLLGYHHPCSVC